MSWSAPTVVYVASKSKCTRSRSVRTMDAPGFDFGSEAVHLASYAGCELRSDWTSKPQPRRAQHAVYQASLRYVRERSFACGRRSSPHRLPGWTLLSRQLMRLLRRSDVVPICSPLPPSTPPSANCLSASAILTFAFKFLSSFPKR